MLEYKGYTGRVEFDDQAMLLHGEVIGLSDVITFQGTSVDELEEAFRDSIDDYLEFCEERGKEPEKPYSGRFLLRLPPQLHRAIHMRARYEGKSLNRWITELLQTAVYAELSSSQKESPAGPGTGEPISTFTSLSSPSSPYAEQGAYVQDIAEHVSAATVLGFMSPKDVPPSPLAEREGFIDVTERLAVAKNLAEAGAKNMALAFHVWETAHKGETPHGPEGEE